MELMIKNITETFRLGETKKTVQFTKNKRQESLDNFELYVSIYTILIELNEIAKSIAPNSKSPVFLALKPHTFSFKEKKYIWIDECNKMITKSTVNYIDKNMANLLSIEFSKQKSGSVFYQNSSIYFKIIY